MVYALVAGNLITHPLILLSCVGIFLISFNTSTIKNYYKDTNISDIYDIKLWWGIVLSIWEE